MRGFEKLLYNDSFDELNNMVRWNGFNRIKDETVGHHSFIVSWLSRILAEEIFEDCSAKLLTVTYGTFHDFNEFITGDMNHNVKYNPFNGFELRKNLNDYIHLVVDEKFPNDGNKSEKMLNYLLKDEIPIYIKKLVKLCDWMSMLMYLKKEQSLGNKNANLKIKYCEEMMIKTSKECIQELEFQEDYKVDCSILK